MKGMPIKGIVSAVVLAACALVVPAQADTAAAPAKKPLTAQQQKMKDCNAEAKTKALKGADRKAFMKTCLSKNGSPAAAAAPAAPLSPQAAQQQKMKDCNKQAATQNLKGDDRKTFMSTCLKG